MKKINLAITGCLGRMGQQLIKSTKKNSRFKLVSITESKVVKRKIAGIYPTTNNLEAFRKANVIIDFTSPKCTLEVLKIASKLKKKVIIGTTGFDSSQESKINGYAEKVVVVKAGNMSLGINILTSLVEKISSSLDSDFDTEILEMHHRNKVDAPSGTALMLGEAAAKGKGKSLSELRGAIREGTFGIRDKGSIGFASLRGGGIVGEHEVSFTSESERISIKHEAFSRDIFVKGAIKAALWSKEKKPGLYDMLSVLNLR